MCGKKSLSQALCREEAPVSTFLSKHQTNGHQGSFEKSEGSLQTLIKNFSLPVKSCLMIFSPVAKLQSCETSAKKGLILLNSLEIFGLRVTAGFETE